LKVEEGIAEVKRVAQSHCPRCGSGRMEGIVAEMAAKAGVPHTCEQDMVVAMDLALAAHDDICDQCEHRVIAYELAEVVNPCKKRTAIEAMKEIASGTRTDS